MDAFRYSKWISNKSESEKWLHRVDKARDSSYILRKSFTLNKEIKKAVLNVCGLGYGVYYINGMRAHKDVLTTPFSKYDATVYYNEYDITQLLRVGENAFGAHLGNGMYNDVADVWNYDNASWKAFPKLIMEIIIDYSDGTSETVASDSSFKASIGPTVYNHYRAGEIYDANLWQDGWNDTGFDDNAWENAFVCRGAGGVLSKTDMPPIMVTKTLPLKKLNNNMFTTTQNISGWVKIKVRGKKGDTVTLEYGEALDDENTINQSINRFNHTSVKHTDTYILKGGVEEYAPSFVYHGFRFVKIVSDAEIVDAFAQVVHTDLKSVGDFQCSDEMLNKIHSATRWATLTNYMGIPTDCPQREQNGWTGDALLSAEQALMNFDMESSYKKWLNDFKDVQRPNGQLPGIVPTWSWGYNWGSGPAWDSAMMLIPLYIYNITGSTSSISMMWDSLKLYYKFLESMSEDYIVDFGLGDWCPPADSVICPSVVTDTAYYYVDSLAMVKYAEILGEDSSYYLSNVEKIKNAFRKKFLSDDKYMNCQTFIACGIYQGLFNESEINEMSSRLNSLVIKNDYHIDCGILGAKYIFSALSENGYANTVYKMVTNPTCPSYAYWILNGMTTLCEQWSMKNNKGEYDSLNHHMFSEVDMWFYKHLAGIQLNEGNILINPCFIDGIDFVKANHRDISVYWDKGVIKISVPKNAVLILDGMEIPLSKGEHEINRRR